MLEIVVAGAGREEEKIAAMRARAAQAGAEIDRAVADILEDVRRRGLEAVEEYSLRFDHAKPREISREELRQAADRVPAPLLAALERSACQIRHYQGRLKEEIAFGTVLWDSPSGGQVGRTVRVMVLGIPNVGKSTFINKVARRKTARAEDRPGVTRSKQWVPVDSTLELLDTPGILWPRFDDPEVGKRLAFTGAIKDDVVDMEELACYLMDYLGRRYAPVLEERYKIEVEPEDSGYDLLEKAGRKRGFLMRGAQVDTQRMARVLLDEFRGGKLGRFTLETVEDAQ